MTSWTHERSSALERMKADGFTFSMIAAELGGVTRNACIGKAHRMGLLGKPPGRPKQTMRKTPKRVAPVDRLKSLNLEPEITDLPPDQPPDACTLAALTDETCRWPLGTPAHDMLYCGSPHHAPFPYCTRHAQIAYKPIGRR